MLRMTEIALKNGRLLTPNVFRHAEHDLLIATIAMLLLVAGCNRTKTVALPRQAPTDKRVKLAQFVDVRSESGILFTYRNGQEAEQCAILESLGGGVGLADFDLDGWVDVCLTGGGLFAENQQLQGLPSGLFRNLGGLRFQAIGELSGLSPCPFYSHGVSVADYNNDGFVDVLITGYGGVLLWTNQGDGTFIESSKAARLNADRWGSSAAWCDFNEDGCLDLYLANYVDWSFQNHPICSSTGDRREICSPKMFNPVPHYLFYSAGDGTFAETSKSAGLRDDGKGLGVVAADIDHDQDVDIYVANDTTPNFLYLNDGTGNFEEVGLLRGTALDDQGISNGSMGVDLCDYNLDGASDIWVANYEHETFAMYRNEGRGFFLHVSQATGVASLGQLFVGFGTACADFDHDGDEDITVANGHVIKYPSGAPRRQLPIYLENRNRRFHRIEFPSGNYFASDQEGRGLAAGDLDHDGDLDVVISHLNDPVSVLRNDLKSSSWIAVQLIGTASNRAGLGARLTLETSKGNLVRQLKGGGSYLSTHDLKVHWGIPIDATVERLRIEWPSGIVQVIERPEVGKVLQVVEE